MQLNATESTECKGAIKGNSSIDCWQFQKDDMDSMNDMPSPASQATADCPLRDNEKDPYAFDANPMDWAEEGRQYGWHLLTLDEIRERYMDKRCKLPKQIEGWIFQGKPWHVLPGQEHGKSVCWIPFGSARMSRPEERHDKWLFWHGRPSRAVTLPGMVKWDNQQWQSDCMHMNADGVVGMHDMHAYFWTFRGKEDESSKQAEDGNASKQNERWRPDAQEHDDPYPMEGVSPLEWAEEGRKYGWHLLTLDELRKNYVDRKSKQVKPVEAWIFPGKPWHVFPGKQHGARLRWIPSGGAHFVDERDGKYHQWHAEWLFGDGRPSSRVTLAGVKQWNDDGYWGHTERDMFMDNDGVFGLMQAYYWIFRYPE